MLYAFKWSDDSGKLIRLFMDANDLRHGGDKARLLQPTLFKELEKGTLLLSVNGLFK